MKPVIKEKISFSKGLAFPRICDFGGWTDTYFSVKGEVLNLGVLSRYFGKDSAFRGIEVFFNSQPATTGKGIISIIDANPNYDVTSSFDELQREKFDRSNLLLSVLYLLWKEGRCQAGKDLEIHIQNPIPPGASLGTSATVAVAFIKAVCSYSLANPVAAILAWRSETEVMGGESGTQDQFAAAYGYGVNRISITKYPETICHKIKILPETKEALESGLITVFYGRHSSSDIHRKVIKELKDEGPQSPRLEKLRGFADLACKALEKNNLKAFGEVARQNTQAQRELCEGLVCDKAQAIIKLAEKDGAFGWKVNGAGGNGGSITLIFPNRKKAEEFFADCSVIYANNGYIYFEHRLLP